ncbi:MAG: hypothetical protein HYS70_05225 [Nitrospinae bacterium]|nr:hypothetical protein [Nitrospinota bacterium]
MKGRGKGTKRLGGILIGLMALGCWMAPAFAEDSAARIEQLAQKVQQLQAQQEETQRQLKTLLEELGRIKGNPANPGSAVAQGSSVGKGKEGEKEDEYFEVTTAGSAPGSSTRVSSLAESLDFHGYLDLNYSDSEVSGIQGNPSFDNNHLTLWTGWKIHEKVYAKAELEYEHTTNIASRGGGKDGEVKIEVAQIDLTPTPKARLSLGSIIVPFGIEGEAHASPINRLVTRPTAARNVVPGTWTDVGLWGNYTVPRVGELALFVVNGDVRHGGFGRDNRNQDLGGNDGKSLGGRLRFNQLVPGLDFGLSLVSGKHDEKDNSRASRLGFHLAADLKQLFSLTRDLRVVGEWFGGRDEEGKVFTRPGSQKEIYDAHLKGWYFQVAQGITPGLEAIARFGEYNMDREITDNRFREFSLGLGYSPLPNLRFKVEYQWNREQGQKDVDNNLLAGQAVVAW